jgi:hypothetical protein
VRLVEVFDDLRAQRVKVSGLPKSALRTCARCPPTSDPAFKPRLEDNKGATVGSAPP